MTKTNVGLARSRSVNVVLRSPQPLTSSAPKYHVSNSVPSVTFTTQGKPRDVRPAWCSICSLARSNLMDTAPSARKLLRPTPPGPQNAATCTTSSASMNVHGKQPSAPSAERCGGSSYITGSRNLFCYFVPHVTVTHSCPGWLGV